MTSLSCGPTTTVGGAWRSIATMTDADEPASGAEGPGRRHLAEFPGAHRTMHTDKALGDRGAGRAEQNLKNELGGARPCQRNLAQGVAC